MSYRVPVLETFNFQKQVISIVDTLPVADGSHKGERYVYVPVDTGDVNYNKIAWCDGLAWKFDTPATGWFTFINNLGQFYRYDGTKWDQLQANDIKVNAEAFSVQFPTGVSSLQELLVWMDANVGGPGPMGVPSDEVFSDGLLEWTSSTKVVDALDDTNEILFELAPPQANSLAGLSLSNNRTLYSGKLPAGLGTEWESGASIGDTIQVLTSNTVTLATPSTADTFSKGDEGLLIGNVKHGSTDFNIFAKINISANFVEPAPGVKRVPNQDLTQWNKSASEKYPCADCDIPVVGGTYPASDYTQVSKNGGNEILRILDVSTYNDFSKWQKMNANIQLANLTAGYHEAQMIHNVRGIERATTVTKFFYDDSVASVLSVSGLSINEVTPVFNYVSGVKYYGSGSTFNISFTANNIYQKIYRADKVASYAMENTTGGADVAPDINPNFDAAKVVENLGTLTVSANAYSINARAYVDLFHPYKTLARQYTPGRLINSYATTRDTATQSFWTDESRRLAASFTLDTIPAANEPSLVAGGWDSTQLLGANDALIYNSQLQYGNLNLSATIPTNPDYSTKTGNQIYVRAFNIGVKSGMTLNMPGLVNADVAAIGTGNINVEIKLPGLTGWCDGGKDFNVADFGGQPKDGAGVRNAAASGSIFNFTFGGMSTTTTNGWVLVRITFRNATKSINGTMVAA